MDGEERVRTIVFAGKKLPQLEFLQPMEKRRLFARQFLFCFGAMSGIWFFSGELPERFEIRDGALQLAERIQQRAQPR